MVLLNYMYTPTVGADSIRPGGSAAGQLRCAAILKTSCRGGYQPPERNGTEPLGKRNSVQHRTIHRTAQFRKGAGGCYPPLRFGWGSATIHPTALSRKRAGRALSSEQIISFLRRSCTIFCKEIRITQKISGLPILFCLFCCYNKNVHRGTPLRFKI